MSIIKQCFNASLFCDFYITPVRKAANSCHNYTSLEDDLLKKQEKLDFLVMFTSLMMDEGSIHCRSSRFMFYTVCFFSIITTITLYILQKKKKKEKKERNF